MKNKANSECGDQKTTAPLRVLAEKSIFAERTRTARNHRARNQGTYLGLEHPAWDLSPHAFRAYMEFLARCTENGYVEISERKLAKFTDMTRDRVRRAVKELTQRFFIDATKFATDSRAVRITREVEIRDKRFHRPSSPSRQELERAKL